MTVSAPRERFAELARGDDADIDLAAAALWIAAEAYPGLDIERYLRMLDELAREAGASVLADAPAERVSELLRFLFSEQRFVGNTDDYYDPRNSMLNEVLDRRTGIPISLALLVVEVARRIGLELCGVSFPGHFLVRTADEPPTLVDAFSGRILEREECEVLLRKALGKDASLEPEHLRAASAREVLVRMLANLKRIYLQREDLEAALACSDRLLMLLPDTPLELRDRGLIHAGLECFGPALVDLERFVELARSPEVERATRDTIDSLRVHVRQIH